MNTKDYITLQINDYVSDEIDYPTMYKNIDKFLSFKPMSEFPEQVKNEHFSKTVLVYDEDLDFYDLGFYDYKMKKWIILGGMQMKLVCWNYVSIPKNHDVENLQSVLTD